MNKGNSYKLRCACGGRLTAICQPEDARRMLGDFNRRHSVCTAAEKFRCGVCGCLLLGKDVCPMHVSSARVAWAVEIEKAYWAVVEAHASGLTPSVPMADADVYSQAIDLARRWGGHRVVSLRSEVVA